MKFHETVYYNRFPTLEFTKQANIWCIGDVHGCAEEFEELCSMIIEHTPCAKIIQLGDLIDRGPFFKEVFDVIEKYNIELIIGNHEMNFVMENGGYKKCRSKARSDTHDKFSKLSYLEQENILEMIMGSNNLIFAENVDTGEEWILSHAPLKNYESGGFVPNGFNCCSRSIPYKDELIHSGIRAIHGHQHWNYREIGLQLGENKQTLNIDSGCVYGNSLIAVNLTNQDVLGVKSKKTYATSI